MTSVKTISSLRVSPTEGGPGKFESPESARVIQFFLLPTFRLCIPLFDQGFADPSPGTSRLLRLRGRRPSRKQFPANAVLLFLGFLIAKLQKVTQIRIINAPDKTPPPMSGPCSRAD